MVLFYVRQLHRIFDKRKMLLYSFMYMLQCSVAKSSGLQY